jgi:beta-fructofuranosidase
MYYGFPEGLMIAVSSDPLLLNWTRLQREPVIKVDDIPKEPKTGYSVPDPFIWKEDGKYYALIGA